MDHELKEPPPTIEDTSTLSTNPIYSIIKNKSNQISVGTTTATRSVSQFPSASSLYPASSFGDLSLPQVPPHIQHPPQHQHQHHHHHNHNHGNHANNNNNNNKNVNNGPTTPMSLKQSTTAKTPEPHMNASINSKEIITFSTITNIANSQLLQTKSRKSESFNYDLDAEDREQTPASLEKRTTSLQREDEHPWSHSTRNLLGNDFWTSQLDSVVREKIIDNLDDNGPKRLNAIFGVMRVTSPGSKTRVKRIYNELKSVRNDLNLKEDKKENDGDGINDGVGDEDKEEFSLEDDQNEDENIRQQQEKIQKAQDTENEKTVQEWQELRFFVIYYKHYI